MQLEMNTAAECHIKRNRCSYGARGPLADHSVSIRELREPEAERWCLPNLGEFVANQGALLKLGKALLWDMQLGSEGVPSCASCHFHVGG
jgi:cytochrome c peroxidase